MAEVRLAAEARPDRSVGLCVLKRPLVGAPRDCIDALIEEGRVCRRLRHPNIAELYDAGVVAGQPYLAFELVDGVSLRELQRILGPARLPLFAALEIAIQAADALAHAHAAVDERGAPLGIVHRDVTPQNVLVERSGRVKLVDFGIARFSDRGQATRHGQIKGKLGYLAPEQLRGGPVDGRTDVFSLGLVLTELITRRPLLPKVLMVVADLEPALRAAIAECSTPVPPLVTAFLARMVAVPIDARPTAAEVALELRRITTLIPRTTTLAELVTRSVFPHLVPLDLSSVVEGRTTRVAVVAEPADDDDDDDAPTIRVPRITPRRTP
ncbi:serine/threonine protein kinase [Myxococcota bacterium]|nr:serine/threonine protein kinase [Myxococcota bacterium]